MIIHEAFPWMKEEILKFLNDLKKKLRESESVQNKFKNQIFSLISCIEQTTILAKPS
jgi:hypothetical protein